MTQRSVTYAEKTSAFRVGFGWDRTPRFSWHYKLVCGHEGNIVAREAPVDLNCLECSPLKLQTVLLLDFPTQRKLIRK